MLHVTTLGELRQRQDGDPTRPLRRKPLALVAYLARRGPRPVSRTELATLFWGERGEERARQSLRQTVLEVKQALGDAIEVDHDSLRLAADHVELDVVGFERDLAAGRLVEAVARWTGDFFEGAEDIGGDGFRRWIDAERIGLHQQFGVAMGRLIGDAELRGDWVEAAARAERWATALPFDENAHLRLIEALRMTGRNAEALQVHAGFVSRVRAALDLEPSPEFLRLAGGLADEASADLARRGRGSAAIHAPTMIGRGPILDELLDAWRRAGTGHPAVVLVRGEAGSGLTRIADELIERVGTNRLVLRGRGQGTERDFAMAAEVFDGIRQAPGASGAAPTALAEVARIVPALAARFRHLPIPSDGDAGIRDGLVQVLAAIADEQPILIIGDDLTRADEPSRQLLASLAPRLTGRTMMVLLEDESHPMAGVGSSEMTGARGFRRLHLEELSVADLDAMLRSMVTTDPDHRRGLAERLHREGGGLPYTVREVITNLVDDHLLHVDGSGTWRMSPALAGRPLPIPGSLRDRIGARLDQLGPAARGLAEAMAVLEESIDPAVAAALADVPADAAETAVIELTARRLARADRDHPGRVALAPPLVARAIVALLTPTRRQALHARAAKVLAERDLATTAERSLLPYHLARGPNPIEPASPPEAVDRSRQRVVAAAAALVLLTAAVVVWRPWHRPAAPAEQIPIIALGRINDYRDHATTDLARPLTDMLATNLGRIRGLRVVSTARMYELLNQGDPTDADTSAAGMVAAARRAGATDLIDGALYAHGNGGFRLDLRQVELGSGNIKQTHSVMGATVFEVADSGTARLASDLGETMPLGSVADVTTRSVAAYRFYEQGLRAYYANDPRTAEPLFEAALAEDTTFAMAAYYAALSTTDGPRAVLARLAQAERLSARASDRERLTILAWIAFHRSTPSLRALADTLAVRYPDETEGYYFTGLSRSVDGDFLDALAPLNRVVAMDSLALHGDRSRCAACEALRQIVSVYQLADSLPAAERTARRWTRLQPNSSLAWHNLAVVLSQSGRAAEAEAVLDIEARLDAGRREGDRLLIRAVHRFYAGAFGQAERLLDGEIESGSPGRVLSGRWYRALTRRQRGRLEEALADARAYRAALAPSHPKRAAARGGAPQDALAEAQILFEMGRYQASAALFDSIARWDAPDESASHRSHIGAWALTHSATARAAAGDTTGFVSLADSIEALGIESGSGRDRRLHHHIRGLLLAARGDHEGAAAAYRRAIFSWNFGYTRTNVALAASLLRLGRPRDAVPVLQAALRSNLEASNFYLTRTEAHEQLARAWDAVGDQAGRDSAAAHYHFVVRAWDQADPSLAARIEHARRRLADLRPSP